MYFFVSQDIYEYLLRVSCMSLLSTPVAYPAYLTPFILLCNGGLYVRRKCCDKTLLVKDWRMYTENSAEIALHSTFLECLNQEV
jgi:hypothetical protein